MLKTLLNFLPVTVGFAAGIAGAFLFTFYWNRKKRKEKRKDPYIVKSKPYDFHF